MSCITHYHPTKSTFYGCVSAPYSNLRIAEALAGLHVLRSNLCQWLVATTLYFVLKFPFQQSKVESHFDPFTEEDLLSKRKKTVTSRHYLSFLYLSVVCSHSLLFHHRFLKCQSARLPNENHEESSSSRLLTIC